MTFFDVPFFGVLYQGRKYLLIAYLIMTVIAFAAYGIDKYKAQHGKWRTKEKTLLLLAFLLGGVGAFLGMRIFRHKTKHLRFQILVPLFLILQVIAAGVLVYAWYF